MTDHNLLELSGRTKLRANITWLMLKGAGYAALFVAVIWIGIAVLAAVGTLLPSESRDQPDPTPSSWLFAPADMATFA